MATLKETVRKKMSNGMWAVYVRVTHNRKVSYIKTSWVVSDKGLSGKKEIVDPFVLQQTASLMEKYYHQLNCHDTSNWSVNEVVDYLKTSNNDMSFSDYARTHIEKMIAAGRERSSRDYKWALQHLERFAETDNLMFSRLTSSFLNRWVESLSDTSRSKEKYPINIREVYKAAMKEFNDEERGIRVINNPWCNVVIPRSDTPTKRAIPVPLLRKFFKYIPEESRYRHPLTELGQDFALISFCLCGLNAVDLFHAKKSQYVNGVLSYERRKTKGSRSDNAYFEIRVPPFLKPTFDKYLCKDPESEWLFNFHNRLTSEDSFCANLNVGIRQIWEKIDPSFKASFYAFRHSWATIAQNECGASLNDVDFALNHSTNKMARVYVKLDYSPAWTLNEKVIDFLFFTNNDSTKVEDTQKTFERISKYNNVRAEAYLNGKVISTLEDTGFTNVDQIIDKLISMSTELNGTQTRVQFKITNVDKQQTQMYQRIV